jgi:hypothetical protein
MILTHRRVRLDLSALEQLAQSNALRRLSLTLFPEGKMVVYYELRRGLWWQRHYHTLKANEFVIRKVTKIIELARFAEEQARAMELHKISSVHGK